DDSVTLAEEATTTRLKYGDAIDLPDPSAIADIPDPAGSGVRATPDDGPAGMPTGDPSAGGVSPIHAKSGAVDIEGVGTPGSGGIDDLTVMSEDEPSLGLMDSRDPEGDWAADTGPTRVTAHGVQTRDLTDRSSTLRQPPSREEPAPRKRRAPRKSA